MADTEEMDPSEFATDEQNKAARVAVLRRQPMPQPPGYGPSSPAELLLLTNEQTAPLGHAALQYGHQQQQHQQGLQKLADLSAYRDGRLGLESQKVEGLGNYRDSKMDLENQKLNALNAYRQQRITAAKSAGSGSSSPGLTPEALDQLAHQYATTGVMPAVGIGKAGAALKIAVANRAAVLHPEADLAGAKAAFGADSASIKQLQKQYDAVSSFEKTGLKNLDVFLGLAKSVGDTGSPLLNAPYRAFQQKVLGDPSMAGFDAARQTAVQEIAKILSGSSGGAAVSDSARAEASHLLGPDASVAQIMKAAEILKTDMANRKQAMSEQLAEAHERTSAHKKAPAAGGETPTNGAVNPAHRDPRYLYNKADNGRTRILKGPNGKRAPGAMPEPNPDFAEKTALNG